MAHLGWGGRKELPGPFLTPLSPWGRGVGGEGARALAEALPPHPRPLSPEGRGRKDWTSQLLDRPWENGTSAPPKIVRKAGIDSPTGSHFFYTSKHNWRNTLQGR